MEVNRTYNPLSVAELGTNAVRALMSYGVAPLPPDLPFEGAGVYTIHYSGPFESYIDLCESIYVGKADKRLYKRLTEHAISIQAVNNLSQSDFGCRWLVLEQIWIGLTEQILIEQYRPIWNRVIKGFGNHDQGRSRWNQRRSHWDTLHPGRIWAARMQDAKDTVDDLQHKIAIHRANPKTP